MGRISIKWLALGLALISLAFVVIWNRSYVDSRVDEIAIRLELLRDLRRGALETYINTAETELRFWSLNKSMQETVQSLDRGWASYSRLEGDPGRALQDLYIYGNPYGWDELYKLNDAYDGSRYSSQHAKLHPLTKLFVLERGYYDFFLIGAEGDILYSVVKEKDFATNLLEGDFKESGLSKVFSQAVEYAADDRVAIGDFTAYAPSAGTPAIFMAKAMLGVKGELLGVLAVQLPTDRIAEIMNYDAGMGETGETYLVGQDLLMRSNSRFSEVSSILETTVDTDTVELALSGETGVQFTDDYRGVEVLSAYSQVQVGDFHWAVIAEVDRQEILDIAAADQPSMAGIILFLYGLTVWSLWFSSRETEPGEMLAFSDIDLDVDSGGSDAGA
jgi:methyl-accepting chemotaxis protein